MSHHNHSNPSSPSSYIAIDDDDPNKTTDETPPDAASPNITPPAAASLNAVVPDATPPDAIPPDAIPPDAIPPDDFTYNFECFVKEVQKDNKNITTIIDLITRCPDLYNCKLPPFYDGSVLTKLRKCQERERILTACSGIFDSDPDEQLFLAAATLNLEKLNEVLNDIESGSTDKNDFKRRITRVKDSRTVVNFVIKYGDLRSENFVECLKILLDNGVNGNMCDFFGKTPLENLVDLHRQKKILEESFFGAAQLFVDHKCLIRNEQIKEYLTTKAKCHNLEYDLEIDPKTKLYNFILGIDRKKIVNDTMKKEFERLVKNTKSTNIDDGESTLLQLILIKLVDPAEFVEILLKRKMNPNGVTQRNKLAPIELAALENHQRCFDLLLRCKDTDVTEKIYNNFVNNRAKRMKTVYFKLLLESNKLKPHYKSNKAANTPLHYAIIFSYSTAIQKQMKLGASLLVQNSSKKCAIDMIRPHDLEAYLNSCLIPDNHHNPDEIMYKMQLDFAGLINKTDCNELEVINRIKAAHRVKHILEHLLVQVFIILKWYRSKYYYWFIIFIHILFYVISVPLFYHYNEIFLIIPFVVVNLILKLTFVLINSRHYLDLIKKYRGIITELKKYKTENHKIQYVSTLWNFLWEAYTKTSLHFFIELTCCLVMFLICLPLPVRKELCALIFPFMTFSVLLTIGYHPKLSEWSLMLQKIVKTFTILLIFSFPAILAFSLGFNLIFHDQKGADLFDSVGTSILRTFIMITGEFDVYELEFRTVASFALLIMLVIFMYAILMNFLTGVAVSDIQQIKDNSKINAIKSVFSFLKTVEKLYSNRFTKFLSIFLGEPFVFSNKPKNKEKGICYKIDFYMNKDRQIENKRLMETIDENIVNSLRSFVLDQMCDNDGEHVQKLTAAFAKMETKIGDLETKITSLITMMQAGKKTE